MNNILNYVAGGTIEPSRFVKASTVADFQALQCGAGEKAIGVSQEGSYLYPSTSNPSNPTYAATTGESLFVYAVGSICYLTCGSGVTQGDFLKSDSTGQALTATVGDYFGAQAHQSGASGEKILVEVMFGKL